MTLNARERDRTIALAALVQATMLVQQVAETGQVDKDPFETMLKSIMTTEATTTSSVYGSLSNLTLGITELNAQLSKKKDQKDMMLIRYMIGLLHLERKLAKRPDMLDTISREIDQMPQHIDYFGGINSPQVIARFADLYHRTISELKPKIQVFGDPGFLQQADNVNRVRALLLAGIRAAVLWRQKGGRRWHFVFQSNKVMSAAAALQQSI